MGEPEFLMVKNWAEHQHYKDRNPPWIKLYKRLLDDYAFSCLEDVAKGHLVLIWILASTYDNKIPNNPQWVGKKIGANDPVDLASLVSAGFLMPYQDASNLLADCSDPASPREHIELENREHIDPESREQKKRNLNFSLYESGDSNLMVAPPRSLATALGSLNGRVAAKEAEDAEDVAQTLNGFFPPQRIGAGSNPAVVRWLGRIKEQDIAHALNYFRAQTYRVDGEERTWGQLTEDHCQRIITAGLNAILKERS